MNIEVVLKEEENFLKAFIGGEIDVLTAPILREKLTSVQLKEGMHAELNLSDVSYMDSTGLGVIVAFFKNINAKNGHVKLTGLSARLKRLFDITGLGEIMDIETDVKVEKNYETI
ncbi:anti-sigma factor antagonist [Paenisporosarcina sp. TG20]|uniref:anti-sigma factor antagonist n=1 Tax=Paenisporosarcina sp. TG20 TaxID=1211706 RepID=UPI00030C1562|nr:anti-sigma factor antagonist [Paenisporosarcina sp. TG20]